MPRVLRYLCRCAPQPAQRRRVSCSAHIAQAKRIGCVSATFEKLCGPRAAAATAGGSSYTLLTSLTTSLVGLVSVRPTHPVCLHTLLPFYPRNCLSTTQAAPPPALINADLICRAPDNVLLMCAQINSPLHPHLPANPPFPLPSRLHRLPLRQPSSMQTSSAEPRTMSC